MDTFTADRVVRAISAVVPPTARVRSGPSTAPFVNVDVNGHTLRTLWLHAGTPGTVKEALLLIGEPRPDVLVARSMSTGARDLASQAGVGWVDESGEAEVAFDWLVISRAGHGRPVLDPARAKWTPDIAGVAEALLLGIRPTVDATVDATGLSRGLCARSLLFFSERGVLTSQDKRGPHSARHLADPARLLDEYAEAVASFRRTELRVGVLWRDPVEGIADLGRQWDTVGIPWAATGAVGAAVLAPYLTDIGTGDVFVGDGSQQDLSRAAEQVFARPMPGGRLILRPFPSRATARLSTRENDLCIVPWPRVYTDLRAVGVRGEDAAEHLRELMRDR